MLTRPNVSDGKLRTSLNILDLLEVRRVFRVGSVSTYELLRICRYSRCPGALKTCYIRIDQIGPSRCIISSPEIKGSEAEALVPIAMTRYLVVA